MFLCLTIYTAMNSPKVMDLSTLHLPEVLKKADFHKLQMELRTCLPSLPNMPNLHRFQRELNISLPSMDYLPSLSNWYIVELLSNCLPERFTNSNHTDVCVLVLFPSLCTLFLWQGLCPTPITRKVLRKKRHYKISFIT